MPRPKKGTKEHEIATAKWRKTMYEKYGGKDGFHSVMQDRGHAGGLKGKEDGVIKGFARVSVEERKAAGRKGGKASKRGKQISDDIKKDICKDVANGMTMKATAEKYNVSLCTVRNALDAFGEND